MDIIIKKIDENYDLGEYFDKYWYGPVVSRGRKHGINELSALAAWIDDELSGIITFRIEGKSCEVVSINAFKKDCGVGKCLMYNLFSELALKGIKRAWLVTTNDNTRALSFYQRIGFELKALHLNAVDMERPLKKNIPLNGCDGIPIRHELELEYLIDSR